MSILIILSSNLKFNRGKNGIFSDETCTNKYNEEKSGALAPSIINIVATKIIKNTINHFTFLDLTSSRQKIPINNAK